MGYRDNMAIYVLSGKGEIPLNGPSGVPQKKAAATGGSFSQKSDLHKILEHKYSNEIGEPNNIYVKKVVLQMKLLTDKLQREGKSPQVLLDYLGNDEFSDSYLLDMYCEKHCQDSFSTLLKCLDGRDSRVASIDAAQYIALKKGVVGEGANDAVNRPESNVRNLVSPMDIRTRACGLYNNKTRLGKDLFIVFCNLAKDMWMTEMDKASSFKNFAYLASKVYTKPTDLTNQEFDVARDLTLYGNLLKSDVLLYVPQAEFKSPKLYVPDTMPSPLDMTLYSLCGFVNRTVKTGGSDDPEVNALLSGL
jgi:hypothetical protein